MGHLLKALQLVEQRFQAQAESNISIDVTAAQIGPVGQTARPAGDLPAGTAPVWRFDAAHAEGAIEPYFLEQAAAVAEASAGPSGAAESMLHDTSAARLARLSGVEVCSAGGQVAVRFDRGVTSVPRMHWDRTRRARTANPESLAAALESSRGEPTTGRLQLPRMITAGYRRVAEALLAECGAVASTVVALVHGAASTWDSRSVAGLARALAEIAGGRVLWIHGSCECEWDWLGAPGNDAATPPTALVDRRNWKQAVRLSNQPRLDIVPLETIAAAAQSMGQGIWTQLRSVYSLVLADVASDSPGAELIAPAADNTYLVIELHRTPRRWASQRLRALSALGARVQGCIVAHVA